VGSSPPLSLKPWSHSSSERSPPFASSLQVTATSRSIMAGSPQIVIRAVPETPFFLPRRPPFRQRRLCLPAAFSFIEHVSYGASPLPFPQNAVPFSFRKNLNCSVITLFLRKENAISTFYPIPCSGPMRADRGPSTERNARFSFFSPPLWPTSLGAFSPLPPGARSLGRSGVDVAFRSRRDENCFFLLCGNTRPFPFFPPPLL